ncbi:unnamed protein product [Mytilus coruscus]|uniref:Reverse transcriptase domain-containing protein n=1 Tax=Mytilus coruscus TaxID=42192 RepID=A0A6J8CHN9_MYTCO|nr:unnamed protein product [Mytilus coruscus]
MSSKIKWNNYTSKQFPIHQGVTQGGVLSTHLYKLYINDLPEELKRRGLGLNIGLEYCGSSLCADDIVLMTTDETEIQAMPINPRTAYKIYQAYVIPRLLYGLEILPLNSTQMTELKQFHLKTLRCFQSLPIRTATAAVYMLLGALPIEAEMHKSQLSVLYSILAPENTKLKNLVERQMT